MTTTQWLPRLVLALVMVLVVAFALTVVIGLFGMNFSFR